MSVTSGIAKSARPVALRSAEAFDASTGINLAKLQDFVSTQRWYTGKDKTPTTFDVASSVELNLGKASDGARWFNTVVKVGFEDGTQSAFQVPVRVGKDGSVADALASESFVRAYLEKMVDGLQGGQSRLPMNEGTLRFRPTAASDEFVSQLSSKPKIHIPQREQSNTTVFVDGVGALKFVRKLDGGTEQVNPEFELSNVMTAKGSDVAPKLFGAAVIEGQHKGVAAFMHELVPGAQDALDAVGAQMRATPVDQPLPSSLLSQIEALGTRTAQMAEALYVPGGDEAVATVRADKKLLQGWSEKLVGEIDQDVTPALQRYPELESVIPQLKAKARELAELNPDEIALQRIHGDYHLGQVLLDKDGKWVVVDFEGEPARKLAERRAKDSPLRDVAGMLRSLDYAGALNGRSAADVRSLREAFQRGFDAEAAGKPYIPKGETGRKLLDLKELEKAVYEFAYESSSRPQLVHVPLAKLMEIAGKPADEALSAAQAASKSVQDWL